MPVSRFQTRKKSSKENMPFPRQFSRKGNMTRCLQENADAGRQEVNSEQVVLHPDLLVCLPQLDNRQNIRILL